MSSVNHHRYSSTATYSSRDPFYRSSNRVVEIAPNNSSSAHYSKLDSGAHRSNSRSKASESSSVSSHNKKHDSRPPRSTTDRQVGDWSEHHSSSGKKYYYNWKTEVSQWEKPVDWVEWEKRHSDRGRNDTRTSRSSKADGDFQRHGHFNSRNSSNSNHVPTTSSKPQSSSPSADLSVGRQNCRPHTQDSQRNNRVSSSSRPQRSQTAGTRSKHSSPDGNDWDARGHAVTSSTSGLERAGGKRGLADAETATSHLRDGEPEQKRPRHDHSDNNGSRHKSPESSESEAELFSELDMERLPHLLVEIAEKHKINLQHPDAVKKLKYHLKAALQREAEGHLSVEIAESNSSENANFCSDKLSPLSSTQSRRLSTENHVATYQDNVKEETEWVSAEQPQEDAASSTAIPAPPSLEQFYRSELTSHIVGWPAEPLERQARQMADDAIRNSCLDCLHISADLKCARSLVRTAEIRATLLEQRVMFVRQQCTNLDAMKPPTLPADSAS